MSNDKAILKIELNLDGDAATELKMKAAMGGLTVSELLSAFVHDLVSDRESNGSDERMYAENWYDRCYFTHVPPNDFYTWLARHYELEDAVAVWSTIKEAIADMEYYQDDKEYQQELREIVVERCSAIEDLYRKYGGTGDWKEEMHEAARRWAECETVHEEPDFDC